MTGAELDPAPPPAANVTPQTQLASARLNEQIIIARGCPKILATIDAPQNAVANYVREGDVKTPLTFASHHADQRSTEVSFVLNRPLQPASDSRCSPRFLANGQTWPITTNGTHRLRKLTRISYRSESGARMNSPTRKQVASPTNCNPTPTTIEPAEPCPIRNTLTTHTHQHQPDSTPTRSVSKASSSSSSIITDGK